jgi:hypothetical protein
MWIGCPRDRIPRPEAEFTGVLFDAVCFHEMGIASLHPSYVAQPTGRPHVRFVFSAANQSIRTHFASCLSSARWTVVTLVFIAHGRI